MKKTRKSMLLSSAAMLMVSTIALSTATYAWFTTGTTAKVTGFELTAQSANGIQISANGTTWVNALVVDDLKKIETNNILGMGEGASAATAPMKPMSSAGKVESGKLKLFGGDIDTSKGLFMSHLYGDDDKTSYVMFDLYVKNDGAAQPFKLDMTTEATDNATSIKSQVLANAEGTDTGIQNAVRVAFVNQGSIGSLAFTGTLPSSGANDAWIWEPNSLLHKGKDNDSVKTAYKGLSEAKTGGHAIGSTGFVEDGILAENTTTYDGTSDLVIGGDNATLGAATVTKYTVYIWLEGQDVDCTNAQAGGSIKVDLGFKGEEQATQ